MKTEFAKKTIAIWEGYIKQKLLILGTGKKNFISRGLGMKIGGGFLLLISLSMVIAATGLVGVNKLNKVFNENQSMAAFVDKVYQVGAAVKDYQRSDDSMDITRVNDLVRELEVESKKVLSGKNDRNSSMEKIWNSVSLYQKDINMYALLKNDQDKFYTSYLSCESQAYRLAEEILKTDLERGYAIKTKLAEAGVEVRGYIVDGAQETKKEAYSVRARLKMKEAASLIKNLPALGQDAQMITWAAQLHEQIKSLEDSFEGIRQVDEKKVEQIKKVLNSGEQLLQVVKDIMSAGKADIDRTKNLAYVFLFVVTGACFVSGMLLSVVITKGITRPVFAIVEFAREISKGNLTVPNLEMRSRDDELSVLVQTINEMKNNLNILITNIQVNAASLAAASQQMLSCTEQIAAASQNQANHLDKVTSEVKQLAGAALRVSKNAQNTLTVVEEAKEKARTGEKTVAQAINGMVSINKNVDNLNRSSLRIEEILAMINSISDQSHLISFNAAIEAARAGESGRCFAVVAQEIKKLADTTRKESKEIANIVLTIQKGNLATEKAACEGSIFTEKSGQAFQDIASLVNCFVDKVNEIAFDARNQEIGSNSAVAQIEEVSLHVDQTAAGAEEMLATVEELQGMSEQLQAMTMKFTVNNAKFT